MSMAASVAAVRFARPAATLVLNWLAAATIGTRPATCVVQRLNGVSRPVSLETVCSA